MTLIDNLKQGLSTLYAKLIVRLIEHNSDANAHGTPEQRRNALGLNNHQLVQVGSGGAATAQALNVVSGGTWGLQIAPASGTAWHPLRSLFGNAVDDSASALQVGGAVRFTGKLTVNGGIRSGEQFELMADSTHAWSWSATAVPGYLSLTNEGVGYPLRISKSGSRVLVGVGVVDNGTSALQVGGAIVHGTDNSWAYGSAARRGTTIYLATNPVIGSDARLKTDTEAIPAAIAAEICDSLTPYTYLYKVGGQEAYEVEEDYEVTEPVAEPVTTERTVIEIIDGQAVQVVKTETAQQPVYDLLLVVDEAGDPVLDADGKQLTHKVQRTVKVNKTRKVTKYREIAGKRYHTGYIAQEVKAALDAVADRWPRAANLSVWLLADADDADSTQMIRMEQMIPLIHAAMQHKHK